MGLHLEEQSLDKRNMIIKVKIGILQKVWIPIFIIGICVSTLSFSQKREIGGGIGVLTYTGDLSRNVFANKIKPGATVLYRFNMEDYLSLRVAFVGGGLAETDAKPIDAFSIARASSFNIFVYELSTGLEYYFLDFRSKNSNLNWSPYFYGGLGIFGMLGHQNKTETYSNVQLAIPLAIGFRHNISPKWAYAIEIGVRATFFDNIDNVSGGDFFNKDYQYGNPNDNDEYYFASIGISYTFYKVECPTLPLKQGYRRR